MLNGLPDRDISSISYDESGKSLLGHQHGDQHGLSEQRWRTNLEVAARIRVIPFVSSAWSRGRFVAATPFDGVIVQP